MSDKVKEKKKELESRSYSFDIRSEKRDSGGSTLRGTPIVYSSPTDIGGWFREVIEPGALDGADLTDVPLIVNHNDRMIPVARSRRNTPNSTLRLMVTDRGLEFEADIDTENNMTSKELNSAVDRGDIDSMSFRFGVDKETWENLDTDYPTRHIEKFSRIAEISAVTWPAYEATNIDIARSKQTLDNARAALDNARTQSVSPLDNGNELELLKEKIKLM